MDNDPCTNTIAKFPNFPFPFFPTAFRFPIFPFPFYPDPGPPAVSIYGGIEIHMLLLLLLLINTVICGDNLNLQQISLEGCFL